MKIFLLFLFLINQISHISFAYSEETIPETLAFDFLSPSTDAYKNYYLMGAGGILIGELFLQKLEKNFQKSTVTNKPLGSSSKYGDQLGQGIPNILYFLGAEALGEGHLAGLMLRASLISGLTTDVLKYTIREKRPDSNNKNSFPSGHSTMAFSFASMVGEIHGINYGIPAYLMATFVGYSRINDNKHYLFDVASGALIGTMYGLSIVHRDQNLKSRENSTTYDILPTISHELVGINFNLTY